MNEWPVQMMAPADEFDRLWISRLLLDLVKGRALSVEIEPQFSTDIKCERVVARAEGYVYGHRRDRDDGCN